MNKKKWKNKCSVLYTNNKCKKMINERKLVMILIKKLKDNYFKMLMDMILA